MAHVEIETTKTITLTIQLFNIIGDDGRFIQSINNVTKTNDRSYSAAFIPPPRPFVLQLIGFDSKGYKFAHITKKTIEVSGICLSLGELA